MKKMMSLITFLILIKSQMAFAYYGHTIICYNNGHLYRFLAPNSLSNFANPNSFTPFNLILEIYDGTKLTDDHHNLKFRLVEENEDHLVYKSNSSEQLEIIENFNGGFTHAGKYLGRPRAFLLPGEETQTKCEN
ncbi:MAG: hypothetical protein PHY93_12530 [Bacteriovorax sp.]|nr:hypothetical protein [Bacteriovorax sp.]